MDAWTKIAIGLAFGFPLLAWAWWKALRWVVQWFDLKRGTQDLHKSAADWVGIGVSLAAVFIATPVAAVWTVIQAGPRTLGAPELTVTSETIPQTANDQLLRLHVRIANTSAQTVWLEASALNVQVIDPPEAATLTLESSGIGTKPNTTGLVHIWERDNDKRWTALNKVALPATAVKLQGQSSDVLDWDVVVPRSARAVSVYVAFKPTFEERLGLRWSVADQDLVWQRMTTHYLTSDGKPPTTVVPAVAQIAGSPDAVADAMAAGLGLERVGGSCPARACRAPGDGGLREGAWFRKVGDVPLVLYRAYDGVTAKRDGRWWSIEPNQTTREAYRRAYAICPEWNKLTLLESCPVKVGAELVIGPGQRADCPSPGTPGFAASGVAQVYLPDPVTEIDYTACVVGAWTP